MTTGQKRGLAILDEIIEELSRYPNRPPEFYQEGMLGAHRAYLSAMFLQSICRDVRNAINGVMS